MMRISLFLFFLCSSSFAQYKVDTEALRAAAFGMKAVVYSVTSDRVAKAKTVEDVLRAYGLREGAEAANLKIVKNGHIPGVDEATDEYGTTSRDEVEALLEGTIEENEPAPKRVKLMKKLLDRAQRAGAVFAYTSNGGSVCGVTFPSPLLIDMEEKIVYELVLVGGPC